MSKNFPGAKKEPIRVCMLGLDAAGKTTVVQKLKLGQCSRTLPTIGFNVDTITPCKGLTLTIWDIGGQDKIRQLWKHYYTTTEGIIYIVDSADLTRFDEASMELRTIIREQDITKVPLVVLANKQDLPNAKPIKEIENLLELNSLPTDALWHIEGCCALKGDGLLEAFETLGKFIRKLRKDGTSAPLKP